MYSSIVMYPGDSLRMSVDKINFYKIIVIYCLHIWTIGKFRRVVELTNQHLVVVL